MDDWEIRRIQQVYAQRDATSGNRYAWYQPDVLQQVAERNRILAKIINQTIPKKLNEIDILDLGCGTGEFLRLLVEWGFNPYKLTGVELLSDRLNIAKEKSHPGINWHYGQIEELEKSKKYDLITTFTVFSSILDENIRKDLAESMWRRLKPGGWLLIFDFRYNNPKNKNVGAIEKKELARLWPQVGSKEFNTLHLAPPLARKVAKYPLLYEILNTFCPFCRSHFIYMAQKI